MRLRFDTVPLWGVSGSRPGGTVSAKSGMASYLPAVKFAIKPEHGHGLAYQFSKSRQQLRRQGDLSKLEFRYADAILLERIYEEITRLIQLAQSAGIFQDRLIFGNGIVHSRHTV